MNEKLSSKHFEQEWQLLLQRKASYQTTQAERANTNDTTDDDPFDCSNIVIPPLQVIAEQVVAEALQKWEKLEERKVSRETNPTWYENHVRLPDHFDYTTTQPQNPYSDDHPEGDRVVSLVDPSVHLSYERALWELFAAVPRASEMVRRDHALSRTQHVLQEIRQGFRDYSRIDGHALARLRRKDRHGLPPSDSQQQVSTVCLECWRRLPGRFGAVEPHRMVMEFLGTQTLFDVHRAIIELADDRLWNRSRPEAVDSGFFFMEGTFYGVGRVDYISPILAWLFSEPESVARRTFLGLTDVPIFARPMQAVALQDLELRLGVRYVHVCHGDVECSIYLVDRKIGPKQPLPYPLLHDIWSPSFALAVDCEACRVRTATLVTSTSCEESLGHRLLCQPCCRDLRVPDACVEDYMIWKGQSDWSSGACGS
ncbi:hypothetical protein FisN_3Lh362 [Fistulifera solaris]|uniref:snRNA-activating protein complex subunit 3 n=1 Tax=Fistulifera solaris TaxID=1519565 RepID=A0A1Z5J894_FISSO|nr:hypothetical protein FisN_3Lh362 [Fistulifera solaris]|eukprot:GAX10166.1 hypothetical protein FisN_3Lh362 [Fistulifera solaris]